MQQIPSWETNWFVGSQEIPHILWNPKVHYRVQKWPPPVPTLRQFDPVHTRTSHFLKFHLNIIFPFTPVSPQWSLSPTFPHQSSAQASSLPHTRYMLHQSHSSRFYHPHNIGWGVQNITFLIMNFSPFPCYLMPLRPKYSPQHPILKEAWPTFLPQCHWPSFTPIKQEAKL